MKKKIKKPMLKSEKYMVAGKVLFLATIACLIPAAGCSIACARYVDKAENTLDDYKQTYEYGQEYVREMDDLNDKLVKDEISESRYAMEVEGLNDDEFALETAEKHQNKSVLKNYNKATDNSNNFAVGTFAVCGAAGLSLITGCVCYAISDKKSREEKAMLKNSEREI